jgi:hypothetical protein
MPYTQNDIDTLKAAIATGALECEFGSGAERRRVKYRNLAEMKQTLSDMQAEVAPNGMQSNRTVGQFESGLGYSGDC